MKTEELKQQAAEAAIKYIQDDMVVGVGTGSTVNFFIQALGRVKGKIDGTVASSVATEQLLKAQGIKVYDLTTVNAVNIYVDGADEINQHLQMIKGGGGALTREKIIAQAAKEFICIADEKKLVPVLGNFPIAVEVIPMARSLVAREIIKLGGFPMYRENFVTDNGNIILDVQHLPMTDPIRMEEAINNMVGAVCNGIFAKRTADKLLLATQSGVQTKLK